MVLFALTVKKIKDAAHKNGDVDGMCKQALRMNYGNVPVNSTLIVELNF